MLHPEAGSGSSEEGPQPGALAPLPPVRPPSGAPRQDTEDAGQFTMATIISFMVPTAIQFLWILKKSLKVIGYYRKQNLETLLL